MFDKFNKQYIIFGWIRSDKSIATNINLQIRPSSLNYVLQNKHTYLSWKTLPAASVIEKDKDKLEIFYVNFVAFIAWNLFIIQICFLHIYWTNYFTFKKTVFFGFTKNLNVNLKLFYLNFVTKFVSFFLWKIWIIHILTINAFVTSVAVFRSKENSFTNLIILNFW